MTSPMSRRQFVRFTLLGILAGGSAGCGTILHPERRGQPAGPLDWKIVALDAVGLFFFFVPGVIAFAVDFNNGTIYLPSGRYGRQPRSEQDRQLVSRRVPKEQLTIAGVEQAVSTHTNRDVRLVPGRYTSERLDSIDGFWAAHGKLTGR